MFFQKDIRVKEIPFKVVRNFSLSTNHGEEHLRLVLYVFSLEKFTNHFWKVKMNIAVCMKTQDTKIDNVLMYYKKVSKFSTLFWRPSCSSYIWTFQHYRGQMVVAVDLTRFRQNLMRHKKRTKPTTQVNIQ